MEQGYVQVYTGNGKGKTTCMLGLTLRASGADKSVFIGQFMKEDKYSEISALERFLPQVTVEQYGSGGGFVDPSDPSQADLSCARRGYESILAAATSGSYDIVIADEINVAAYMNLLSVQDILSLIEQKSPHTELVLTGRYAAKEVVEAAHLVTEMTEIKHYYNIGVPSRVGIEE